MPPQNPAAPLDDKTILKLWEVAVRRTPELDWLTPQMFQELVHCLQLHGVELTTLRASLYYALDPRHRFGALRRLAVAMESHPPRTLGQALAFTCATLLEFSRIDRHDGLSRCGPAEVAAEFGAAFKGIALPAWKPGYPHCAGSRNARCRRPRRPPVDEGGEG